MREKRSRTSKPIWAYAYAIVPPQPEERLQGIKALLDHEHSDAKLRAETWRGTLVSEDNVTHILVVSDSPDQSRDVNRRLEAELKGLHAGFSMSAPLAVEGNPDQAGRTRQSSPRA